MKASVAVNQGEAMHFLVRRLAWCCHSLFSLLNISFHLLIILTLVVTAPPKVHVVPLGLALKWAGVSSRRPLLFLTTSLQKKWGTVSPNAPL